MKTDHNELLWKVCKLLPGDYDAWGEVKRWADPYKNYPDCSHGCRFFYPLKSKPGEPLGLDWGVCGNPKSHRSGLLTFEHQGCQQAEFAAHKRSED